MSLQVENLEKNMAKLTIEVSAEELEKAIPVSYTHLDVYKRQECIWIFAVRKRSAQAGADFSV